MAGQKEWSRPLNEAEQEQWDRVRSLASGGIDWATPNGMVVKFDGKEAVVLLALVSGHATDSGVDELRAEALMLTPELVERIEWPVEAVELEE